MPATKWDSLRARHAFFELFDGIVISGQIKLVKPDRAIFDHLVQRFAIDPKDTIFIDDHANRIVLQYSIHVPAVKAIGVVFRFVPEDTTADTRMGGGLSPPRGSSQCSNLMSGLLGLTSECGEPPKRPAKSRACTALPYIFGRTARSSPRSRKAVSSPLVPRGAGSGTGESEA
jgi:hypothetical protein